MQLFRIRCTKCNYIRDFAPAPDGSSAAKYLYYRQHTRSSLRLLSMFSPLADESVSYLARATFECGIISRATTATIVEGLEPNIDHGPVLRAIRKALEFDPTAVVVGFCCMPHQDSTYDFIFPVLPSVPASTVPPARCPRIRWHAPCHILPFTLHWEPVPVLWGRPREPFSWPMQPSGVHLLFSNQKV